MLNLLDEEEIVDFCLPKDMKIPIGEVMPFPSTTALLGIEDDLQPGSSD